MGSEDGVLEWFSMNQSSIWKKSTCLGYYTAQLVHQIEFGTASIKTSSLKVHQSVHQRHCFNNEFFAKIKIKSSEWNNKKNVKWLRERRNGLETSEKRRYRLKLHKTSRQNVTLVAPSTVKLRHINFDPWSLI